MKRLDFVDFWRGVALLSIIVYHFFFDLDFLGIYEVDVFEGAWLVFARFIQFSFLSVVGISTYIIRSRKSYKDFVRVQFRRLARVGLGALMISVVTYFWIPEKMIWFGILHLWMGRNSLMIYLLHQPILLGILSLAN